MIPFMAFSDVFLVFRVCLKAWVALLHEWEKQDFLPLKDNNLLVRPPSMETKTRSTAIKSR